MKRQILITILSMTMMMTSASIAFGATNRPIQAQSLKTVIAAASLESSKSKTGLIFYREEENDDKTEKESGTMISGSITRTELEEVLNQLGKTDQEKSQILMQFDVNLEIQEMCSNLLSKLMEADEEDAKTLEKNIAFLENQEKEIFDEEIMKKALALGYLKETQYSYEKENSGG